MSLALTTLASVKDWVNIDQTSTGDDDLLQELIESASFKIMEYIDRKSLFKQTYPDYFDGIGGHRIVLREWPVTTVNSLTVDAIAKTAAAPPLTGYFLYPSDGFPPGRPQYISLTGSCFTRGIQNVYVNYTAGYCITDETGTINTTDYQITVAQPYGIWGQDDGVKNASTGATLTKVTSAPTTGQYAITAGVYQFAAADTGVGVLISYSYIPASIQWACNKVVGEQYNYRQRIGQKSHTVGSQTTTSFDNTIMTPPIINKLQPYKRMTPF